MPVPVFEAEHVKIIQKIITGMIVLYIVLCQKQISYTFGEGIRGRRGSTRALNTGPPRRSRGRRALGLRSLSGFEPPDLDRPGRQPHQLGPCEARRGCREGSPQLGGPGSGLECTCRHCIQVPGKQRGQSGVRQAKNKVKGGVGRAPARGLVL